MARHALRRRARVPPSSAVPSVKAGRFIGQILRFPGLWLAQLCRLNDHVAAIGSVVRPSALFPNDAPDRTICAILNNPAHDSERQVAVSLDNYLPQMRRRIPGGGRGFGCNAMSAPAGQ